MCMGETHVCGGLMCTEDWRMWGAGAHVVWCSWGLVRHGGLVSMGCSVYGLLPRRERRRNMKGAGDSEDVAGSRRAEPGLRGHG